MQYPDELRDAPPSGRNFHEKSKGIAVIITAVAALVTSFGALVRSGDTTVEKKSYEALSAAVEKLSEENQKNHASIEALRIYLDEDRDARVLAATAPTHDARSSRARLADPRPPQSALPIPPPPPPVGDGPTPVSPPNFSTIVGEAP